MKKNDECGFPICKYHFGTIIKMTSHDINVRKKALRNAASNFISRKDVREFIFQSKGRQCYLCGKQANEIDHKISAYQFAVNPDFDYRIMNSYENLFPICKSCNVSKEL